MIQFSQTVSGARAELAGWDLLGSAPNDMLSSDWLILF